MHITDLDEYQGVTPEMIRDWLCKRGWAFHDGKHRYWGRGKDNFADSLVDGNRDDVAFVIHCEEISSGLSPQESLREINPRMRKGMPSRSALEAHGESRDWLSMGYVLHAVRFCWTVNDHVQMVAGTDVFSTERAEDVEMIQRCSFWPCDAQGNKVRWPTDAQGNML